MTREAMEIKTMKRIGRTAFLPVSWLCLIWLTASANTRTLENSFALSADTHSQYSMQFHVFSPGRVVIEAGWTMLGKGAKQIPLRLVLLRPDGSEMARKEGVSPLRLEYAITDLEIERLDTRNGAKWNVRVTNDAVIERSEVSGKIRITVPASSRAIEDTQFTLLGAGNAQEIPARVPAPGRVIIEADWQTDQTNSETAERPQLTLSLIHPGLNKIYARRIGKGSLRIDQQITEQDLERGRRLIVRIQNDHSVKVKGRVKILFLPSL